MNETASTVTLGWDPVPGAVGYRFTAEQQPKPSHTWDADRTTVRFAKGSAWYRVEALAVADQGTWTGAQEPSWAVLPPTGPLTDRNGGGTQSQWRFDYAVGPVTVEKQHIHDYTSYGYGLMQWVNNAPVESPPGVRSTVRDLRIERITRTPPRSSNGTAEAGVWGGQTGDYYRLDIDACAWMQVWMGARCYRSVWSDIRMRNTQLVGIYPEHNTWDTKIVRSQNDESPGQLANVNNVEWAYGGGFSKGIVWDMFDYYVPKGSYAFFLDAGTGDCVIGPGPGCRVWGPGNIAALPNNRVAGLGPNVIKPENIDMSGLTGNRNVVYHDNAIGSFTQRVAASTRSWVGLAPKLHPSTVRMPSDVKVRLADLSRSA